MHQRQQRLWPAHWDGVSASVLVDLSGGYPLPRSRDTRALRPNASAALLSLLAMPEAEVARLQRAVAEAAPRLVYRRRGGEAHGYDNSAGGRAGASTTAAEDATDVLVNEMRKLRVALRPDERATQRRTVEQRKTDLALDERRERDLATVQTPPQQPQ